MIDNTRDGMPVAAELSVHAEPQAAETPAEQGPPPADFATRPESIAPTPADTLHERPLSGAEVAQMVGSSEAVDTNLDLEEAQGLDSDSR